MSNRDDESDYEIAYFPDGVWLFVDDLKEYLEANFDGIDPVIVSVPSSISDSISDIDQFVFRLLETTKSFSN